MIAVSIAVFASFLLTLLLTSHVRRVAVKRGMIDVPNARSSHTLPTPRGGGLAMVVAVLLCVAILAAIGRLEIRVATALVLGGAAVAAVGFMDDKRGLPARVRFAVHAAAAVGALCALGGLPRLQLGDAYVDLGFFGDLLACLAIVWTLNLFNFMDGIDGIAASEAAFVTGSSGVLLIFFAADSEILIPTLAVAASSLGFLVWNWPPAKIFMGDVGSGFLGYSIAVLALASGKEHSSFPFAWLILGGVFFVDATITLARRFFRRERLHQPHRTHAYQRLARRWASHRKVTVLVWAINIFWLLPMAWLGLRYPEESVLFVLLALTPVTVLAWIAEAGKRDDPTCG